MPRTHLQIKDMQKRTCKNCLALFTQVICVLYSQIWWFFFLCSLSQLDTNIICFDFSIFAVPVEVNPASYNEIFIA